MYSKIFSSLALRTPLIGAIVAERDRLRSEISVVSEERDRLKREREDVIQGQRSSYCHCCRQETVFEIRGNWLRDQYFCLQCFSIPRQRHIQYVLDSFFKGWEG